MSRVVEGHPISFLDLSTPPLLEIPSEVVAPIAQRYVSSLASRSLLQPVVTNLIETGRVLDATGAYSLINKMAGVAQQSGVTTTADFESRAKLRIGKVVQETVGHKGENVIQRHGSISHIVIPKIYSGEAGVSDRPVDSPKFGHQAVLFGPDFLGTDDVPTPFADGQVQEEYAQELFNTWVEILDQFEDHPTLPFLENKPAQKLRRLLEAAFPREVQEISTLVQGEPHDHLPLLTYMTWANVLFCNYGRAPRALFKEKQVLHSPTHRVAGGRTDAIEVTSINDAPPDPEQLERLRIMTREKFASVGMLVNDVINTFGEQVQLTIHDWKFAVGDAPGRNDVIQLDQLDRPFPKHVDQVKRYLTYASKDRELLGNYVPSTGKPVQNYFPTARIAYFHPLSERGPIEFEISMDDLDKDAYIQEKISPKWTKAQTNRALRNLDGILMGILKGRDPDQVVAQAVHPSAMESFIEDHRQFLDDERIIEFVGTDKKTGQPLYSFNFSKIVEGISKGEIPVRGDPSRLGTGNIFIRCISPEHPEKTPSMLVNGVDYIHCFGCGMRGAIDLSSIPQEYSAQTAERVKRRHGRIPTKAELEVPPEHHRAMAMLQTSLEKRFPGSQAEKYIVSKRGIDLGLAEYFGAGNGENAVIVDLLNQGMSLDEMFAYGILQASEKIDESTPIIGLLKKAGFTSRDLERKVGKKDGHDVMGLPYFKLSGRFTFPLINPGHDGVQMISSMYGRMTRDDIEGWLKHRKLNKKNNVAHGVFNPEPFYTGSSQLIITEGVLDALTLIQLGYEDAISIVGTHHNALMQRVADTGKDIAIALDNDAAGKKATTKMVDLLKNVGVEGNIVDFTAQFLETHPDFAPFDDYNSYLQAGQAIRF